MKTLDEVIFEAPYSPTPWEADALFYLKEYRDYRNSDKTAIGNSSVSEAENEPLTWEELREMEGKPVWLEWASGGAWVLIAYSVDNYINFFRFGDDMWFTLTRDEYEPDEWQAYRNERE